MDLTLPFVLTHLCFELAWPPFSQPFECCLRSPLMPLINRASPMPQARAQHIQSEPTAENKTTGEYINLRMSRVTHRRN
jgi:hypothetical protein